jgi:hypothetical protein
MARHRSYTTGRDTIRADGLFRRPMPVRSQESKRLGIAGVDSMHAHAPVAAIASRRKISLMRVSRCYAKGQAK